MHYLGKYGSQSSRQAYDRLIAEFVANGRQPTQHSDEILIEQLLVQFSAYAEKERNYCDSTKYRFTAALRLLNDLHGKTPVTQFNPKTLKSIRQQFLESGMSRNTINSYVTIIRQVFYWGCEEEIVPAEIAGALRTVKMLQKGRTTAIDYEEIPPVADEIVEKTLQHIKSPQIRDMLQVQRLISGRPQDVHNMRFCDIDQSGEVWKYAPFIHLSIRQSTGGKRELSQSGPERRKS